MRESQHLQVEPPHRLLQHDVVWCSKCPHRVLVGAVAKRLGRFLNTLCTEMKVDLLALEIRPDHGISWLKSIRNSAYTGS
jgi:transposase IS200 family protein